MAVLIGLVAILAGLLIFVAWACGYVGGDTDDRMGFDEVDCGE